MIEDRFNREAYPCDRKDCVRYGLWISKIPQRGIVYVQAPHGVQKDACFFCKYWNGLDHVMRDPSFVKPEPPQEKPKKKGGRPRKKPVREVKDE